MITQTTPKTMTTKVKTHIVIPARYHSTRLPAKPLLAIHHKPMIVWTAERAKQAVIQGVADDYVVATDHTQIMDVCQQYNISAVMTSEHHVSGTDRLGEVARQCHFLPDDVVINLQGDEPLMPVALLSQVKDLLLAKPNCAMATLCEPVATAEQFASTSVVKVVFANREALYFSRAKIAHYRDNPDNFCHAYRHLGLYAYRVRLLNAFATWQVGKLEALESLEQLRVLENGEKIAIEEACASLPVGVDTPADLSRLNQLPLSALLTDIS